MIVQYGQKEFNEKWLKLIPYYPVHPGLSYCKRINGNRTLFVFTDNKIPQVVICARIGNNIPQTMGEVLTDDGYESKFDIISAVFYSIFRLPDASVKGVGILAIKELISYLQSKDIHNFYTLSPVPLLKDHLRNKPCTSTIRRYLESRREPVARFHLSNGARVHRINFDADYSELRLNQSWGIMVNYDYNR